MDKIVYITRDFAVTGQLGAGDFAVAAALGFATIINNRPDGEDEAQLNSVHAGTQARFAGLDYHYNPTGKLDLFSDRVVDAAELTLACSKGPILAYCKSGMRSAIVWAAATARTGSVDDLLDRIAAVGFDLDFLEDDLRQQAARSAWTGHASVCEPVVGTAHELTEAGRDLVAA